MTTKQSIPNQGAKDKILGEYLEALHITTTQTEAFEEGVQWLYEHLLKRPKPQIFYIESPHEVQEIGLGQRKINRLTVEEALQRNIYSYMQTTKAFRYYDIFKSALEVRHHAAILSLIYTYAKNGINLKSNIIKIATLDMYKQLFGCEAPDYAGLKKLCYSGPYHIFFWEDRVCALTKAPFVRCDSEQRLHSVVYPAIEWLNGPKAYYIHHREMPEWMFADYSTEELYRRFLLEKNEDIRSGIITMVKEREGNKGMLHFLKAALVDEKEVTHFYGYTEVLRLYKTKRTFDYLYNRFFKANQPYCWSEFTCPSTRGYLSDRQFGRFYRCR